MPFLQKASSYHTPLAAASLPELVEFWEQLCAENNHVGNFTKEDILVKQWLQDPEELEADMSECGGYQNVKWIAMAVIIDMIRNATDRSGHKDRPPAEDHRLVPRSYAHQILPAPVREAVRKRGSRHAQLGLFYSKKGRSSK